MENKIRVNIDGACEPKNPGGTAAYGGVIRLDGKVIHKFSDIYTPKVPGQTSNNIAEYCALGVALKWLKENNYKDYDIEVLSDSQLVVNQMWNNWNINKGLYVPFAEKCKKK